MYRSQAHRSGTSPRTAVQYYTTLPWLTRGYPTRAQLRLRERPQCERFRSRAGGAASIAIQTDHVIPIGLALFAPVSVMVVMGQEYVPNHVGTASGVTLGLAVSTGGILAPLFGSLADRYGLPLVLFGFALLPALAHCFAWKLPEARREGGL
jgi:hypothetical protein